MGNQASCGEAKGKIVQWDGSVQQFDKPMTAAEVMLEHPQHVVVEFHSALTQRRPTPLAADNILDIKTSYLMLPIKRGKAVGLNAQDTRRFLLILNSKSMRRRSPTSRFVPWLARTCHANAIVGEQKKEEIRIMEKQSSERFVFGDEFLGETLEGSRPQYLSRQMSEKGWKPSLDTITEKTIRTKTSHAFFFNPFYSRFHEI